jgi:uncharacterized cupin superfamily protein
VPHTQYIISGRIKVVMNDGAGEEFGPGDAVDFMGLKDYAECVVGRTCS